MTVTVRQLLEVLGDGNFHSGEALGKALSVSRTAIWKQLSKLSDLHIDLESVRGRGYRIPGGLELLSPEEITAGLKPDASALLTALQVLDTIDSTNAYARRQLELGSVQAGDHVSVHASTHGSAYLAECQTGGRGRMGRTWVSPYGRNVYLSLVWEYEGGATVLEGLSLAVGVAVRRAVTALGVADITLKWPNDVLRDGRKLGGILLEMTGDPVGTCRVIVGIGLNINVPSGIAKTIDQPWHDLADHGLSRNAIAAAILSELLPLLSDYTRTGFIPYREEWQGYDAHRGETVQISTPRQSVTGVARGVAENGALCLEVDGQLQYFSGGEVSLRPTK
ncbi:MAG: biotin--[acetyl-CoA-carboxylase] ligase [Porticoccaceae bacterium]